MDLGNIKVRGIIDQDSSGYLKLASGSTETRPTAANGVVRYNTSLGFAEVYQQNAWHKLGSSDGQYDMKIVSIPVSNSLVDPVIFVKNPSTGKYLTDNTYLFEYANPSAADLAWLHVNDSITDANVGYQPVVAATITSITGFASDKAVEKRVSLYIDGVEHANAIVFPAGDTSNITQVALNQDVNAGEKVRFRVRSPSGGNLGAIHLEVFVKFRLV